MRPGAATKATAPGLFPPEQSKFYVNSPMHGKLLILGPLRRLRALVFSGPRIPLLPTLFAILVRRAPLATSAPAVAHVAQLITTLPRDVRPVGKFVVDFIHFASGYLP